MDLMIFEKISWFLRKFWVFLYFVFSSPPNHVGTLIWSLSNCTKAQGTLLDLHGPPNGPLNEPSEANFWGPLVKKGPAGSLHGPNWSIFLDRSLDNVQTWIYSLVWGQSDIRFLSNREFPKDDDDCIFSLLFLPFFLLSFNFLCLSYILKYFPVSLYF